MKVETAKKASPILERIEELQRLAARIHEYEILDPMDGTWTKAEVLASRELCASMTRQRKDLLEALARAAEAELEAL